MNKYEEGIMMIAIMKNIWYGNLMVLDYLNLEVTKGEVLA